MGLGWPWWVKVPGAPPGEDFEQIILVWMALDPKTFCKQGPYGPRTVGLWIGLSQPRAFAPLHQAPVYLLGPYRGQLSPFPALWSTRAVAPQPRRGPQGGPARSRTWGGEEEHMQRPLVQPPGGQSRMSEG